MIFIIYSDTTAASISTKLGFPEYSYYFVLKEYQPVLEQLGKVVIVENPATEVDAIYAECQARQEPCIFLSFSPPNKTLLNLECPTIPVLAWEFDTIPNEIWNDDPLNDWRNVFGKLGWAITHSQFAVKAIKAAMGDDFPVVSIPAPVWDRFNQLRIKTPAVTGLGKARLKVTGEIFDSRTTDLSVYAPNRRVEPAPPPEPASTPPALQEATVHADASGVIEARLEEAQPSAKDFLDIGGVIYTTVFCPYDGRKNWIDMLCTFCWAFKDIEDATLILKLTHRDNSIAMDTFTKCLYKLTPFKCRVIAIPGFLSDHDYEQLTAATTYCVNFSHGEGQCLPLMEFMSYGIPAVTPRHTGMADYIDEGVAFVALATLEPTRWPHDDKRNAYRTKRYRLDWESMVNALRESYRVAKEEPGKYAEMSKASITRLEQHCSRAVVQEKLRDFLSANRRVFRSFTPE